MAGSNALGEKIPMFVMENLLVYDASSTFVTSLEDIDLKRKHGWMEHFGMRNGLRNGCASLIVRSKCKEKKVVMIVNNCSAHPEVSGLKTTNLQFLPRNTTSCTEPMDQWVIRYVCFIIFLFY